MEKKFVVLLSADSSKDTAVYTVHGDVRTEDINDAVYQTMCHVAQDVLERSTCLISGDRTAAEIAGKIGYLNVLMPLTDEQHKMAPQTVLRIGRYEQDRKNYVPQYTCQFPTDMVFEMIAEWEGIASIKKPHLFACECKDERLNKEKLTIYKRSHGYKPTTISLVAENNRIAKRFEVLGAVAQCLNSEGMKKALSVLAAVDTIKQIYGYNMSKMAERAFLCWHWEAYHKKGKASVPVSYTAQDFRAAPDIWKDVQHDYVEELLKRFRHIIADCPAPEGIAEGDLVQLKDQEHQAKKWQGQLKVRKLFAQLSGDCKRLDWYVELYTIKGRPDSMTWRADKVEPSLTPKKKRKPLKSAKPAKAVETKRELTLEEQLRKALQSKLAA